MPIDNRNVVLKISEPWDIGEQLGWSALEASVHAVSDSAVLIKLTHPFSSREVLCEYFVATPRLDGDSVSDLLAGRSVFCALTRVSSEQALSSAPFDLSRWRGGVALIGSVEQLPLG